HLPVANQRPDWRMLAPAERHCIIGACHPSALHVIIRYAFFTVIVVRILGQKSLRVTAQIIDRFGERKCAENRKTMPGPDLGLALKRVVARITAIFHVSARSEARPKTAVLNRARTRPRHVDRPREFDFCALTGDPGAFE